MRNSFDSMSSLIKIFFVVVLVLIIGTIAFRVSMVAKAREYGKDIYHIKVNNLKEYEEYMTEEYTRDKETGCISFKDEFGIKHVVCNNYTITEY